MPRRKKTFDERSRELKGAIKNIQRALRDLETAEDISPLRDVANQLRALIVFEPKSKSFNHPLLIDLANEKHFPLTVYTSRPDYQKTLLSLNPTFYMAGDSILLQKEGPFQYETTLEKVLEEPYLLIGNEQFSLKELIRTIADTEGSHYDVERPNILDKLDSVHIGGLPSAYRSLFSLARVVVALGIKFLDTYPSINEVGIRLNANELIQNLVDGGENGLIRNPEYVLKGQPPIFSDSVSSYYLESPGYLELGKLEGLTKVMAKGFSFGIDIKTEVTIEQVIGGTGITAKTNLVFCYNANNILGRLMMKISDDNSNMLIAYADTSSNPAKRLIISMSPENNRVSFYELHNTKMLLQTIYAVKQSPNNFSEFKYPFLISGHNIDGIRKGKFIGFVSDVLFIDREVHIDEIKQLTEFS